MIAKYFGDLIKKIFHLFLELMKANKSYIHVCKKFYLHFYKTVYVSIYLSK